MSMEFDIVQVYKFIDHENDEEFEYYCFYDSGNDYTSPTHYMDKIINDESYKELSKKIEQLREVIWSNS